MIERALDGEKKADAAEHPLVFDHVGLLANEPLGTGRVALHLVVRRLRTNNAIAVIEISLRVLFYGPDRRKQAD